MAVFTSISFGCPVRQASGAGLYSQRLSHKRFDPMRLFIAKQRLGFTLVELLVVIAIIGVLVALLLPAVQSAREAARRQTCLNNLKQIALAMHNYEDTNKVLPVGLMGGAVTTPDDGFGWGTAILPFIEQKALFDQINPNGQAGVFRAVFNATALPMKGGETPIKTYRCPTSQLPKVVDATWRLPGAGVYPPSSRLFLGYAINDYKGNGGGCVNDNDGVLGKRAEIPWVRFAEITDGLSNVPLVAESSYVTANSSTAPTSITAWPVWVGGPGSDESIRYESGTSTPINCRCTPTTMINAINDDCVFSWHPNGAQVSFCDGSVKFISQNIAAQTWCNMNSRNDGRPVGEY
jgi:prepilin-type N-terminal cleavage/methylation domain-containing protein/prepilin-type processing-associated H-X9-DG protein